MLALSLVGCAPHGAAAPVAAITAPAPAAPAPAAPAVAPAVAPTTTSCLPNHDGYLRLRLRGAQNLDVNWRDRDMECEGGPRPANNGIRLAFLGRNLRDGHRLRFVFGIAAARGASVSHGVPANVTVIFEGESKLYSTQGDDKCTIDQLAQTPVDLSWSAHALRVSGRGFCITPAAAIDGGEGLLLSRFDFAGLMIEDEAGTHAP